MSDQTPGLPTGAKRARDARVAARGAANPQTIRELLDEIIDANTGPWLGQIARLKDFNREHAVAALELLDGGLSVDMGPRQEWVPTPGRYRLVPDPAPRGDTERKRPPLTDAQREDVLLQMEHMRASPRRPRDDS